MGILCLIATSALHSCHKNTSYDPLINETKLTYLESGVDVKLTRVQFLNKDVGYCSGDDGVVIKTTDGGESWTQLTTGVDVDLESVFFINELTGWVTGDPVDDKNTILKTTDGGLSWQDQGFDEIGARSLYSIKFADENTGWIGGRAPSLLYKTIDGGDNWVAQTNFDTLGMRELWEKARIEAGRSISSTTGGTIGGARMYYIHTVDENNVWIGGRGGYLWHTLDGGNSWKYFHFGNYNSILGMKFIDNNTAFICGSNGQVIKLNINGDELTFENRTNYSNTRSFRDIHFFNENYGYAFGEHGYIYKTTDGGRYWGQEINPTGIYILYATDFLESGIGFTVGNNGTIVKIEDPLIIKK